MGNATFRREGFPSRDPIVSIVSCVFSEKNFQLTIASTAAGSGKLVTKKKSKNDQKDATQNYHTPIVTNTQAHAEKNGEEGEGGHFRRKYG